MAFESIFQRCASHAKNSGVDVTTTEGLASLLDVVCDDPVFRSLKNGVYLCAKHHPIADHGGYDQAFLMSLVDTDSRLPEFFNEPDAWKRLSEQRPYTPYPFWETPAPS